jgi:ABC-type nitrate/sulfonate/bicarbonate transport system substrate-binding protein
MREIVVALSAVIIVAAGALWYTSRTDVTAASLKYGITPFQDSALPVVPSILGWYKDNGLDVKLVDLGWGDVPVALASGSIDVALYNFDSFMASWPSLNSGGKDVVFYSPLYVWNGAAIMVRSGTGTPAGDLSKLPPDARVERVRTAMLQLKGKSIGVTEGTTFEQTVLDALRVAGMTPSEVKLINARPEDNLAAFLSGGIDAFSGGLTERVQAERRGGVALVTGPDVSLPIVDGIIALRSFVVSHPKEMAALVDAWFRTIEYISQDVPVRSSTLRDYLRGKASVDYTAEEYAVAWTFQYFPRSKVEAVSAFFNKNSLYYWRPIWEQNSRDLISQGKIPSAIPESAFVGERSLQP